MRSSARCGRRRRASASQELLDRRPRELSGGQQQRVALGRAVVRNPQVFLMDEPLSNLDAKLRVQTRAEIKRLHRDLNATVVYVTHDQLEAMTMSDRVAVMGGGTVHQYGTPLEVFDTPADLFVASFIGSPAMNILRGTLQQDGTPLVRIGSSRWPLPQRLYAAAKAMNAGPEVAYGIRHRDLAISRSEAPDSVHGIVYAVEPTGDITFVHVRVGNDQIVASVEPDVMFAPDEDVWLDAQPQPPPFLRWRDGPRNPGQDHLSRPGGTGELRQRNDGDRGRAGLDGSPLGHGRRINAGIEPPILPRGRPQERQVGRR